MATEQVLDLLLTARYVGNPAFSALSRDIDTLVNSASKLSKVGAAADIMGTLVTAGTIGVAALAAEAIKYSSQFQNEMQRIQAVLGSNLTPTGMLELQKQIVQTSDTYGQSVDQIAQGTYFIVSALGGLGYSVNDVINNQVIPAFGAFVTASGHGLSGSVDWITGAKQVVHILGAMHQPVSSWANDLGILTAAENNSSLSQTNLVQALTKVAPYAQLLGLPFNKTVGLISAEAEAGVYGGLAGTEAASAYRMLFTSPTSAKALAKLGLSPANFLDKGGAVLDPGVMFTLIQSRLAGQTPANRIKLASQIFGAVGFRALGPLMQQYAKAQMGIAGGQNTYYSAIMSKIQGAGLQSMLGVSDTQMQAFAMQLARLTTGFHNFLMLMGGPLITALTPIITRLADALDRLNNALMNKASPGAGGLAAGLAAAFPHLAPTVFGTIAGGALLGPGLSIGGSWLRDFAQAQDDAHTKSLEKFTNFNEAKNLSRAQMVERQTREMSQAQGELGLLMQATPAKRLSKAEIDALIKNPRGDFMKQMGDMRYNALLPYLQRTPTGDISTEKKGSIDLEMQRRAANLEKAQAAAAREGKPFLVGQPTKAMRDYINQHWEEVSKAYGLPAGAVPTEKEFAKQQETLLKMSGKGGGGVPAHARLQKRIDDLTARHAEQLKQFDEKVGLQAPQIEPSAGKAIGKHLAGIGGHIMAFGHALSPLHILHQAADKTIGRLARHSLSTMGAGDVHEQNKAFFAPLVEGGKKLAGAVMGAPGKVVAGFKALPGMFMSLAKALPGLVMGFLSLGSALLPIIAVVLLVVGVIVILVLAFKDFRPQVMGIVTVFKSAFIPVFGFVQQVVMSVLRSIQKAWAQHSKEIMAAMQTLMTAISQSAPFFQELGYVIGGIIAVIVKVIGYLVTAFISALPYIINVFTSIFKFLGDLGMIVQAILHGKWGMAWEYAKKAVADAWGVIKNLGLMLWSFLTTIFGNIWNDIKGPLGSLWSNIANSVGGAFNALGTNLHNALLNAIQSAISHLPGPIAALADKLFGLGGGPVGSGGSSSGGGAHGRVGGHAVGGYIPYSQLSWVGERGPELVRLPGGSQVYKHSDSLALAHALSSGGTIRALQIHIAKLEMQGESKAKEEQGKSSLQRSTAEEYFFARGIQREREAVWNRYPNTSREFDHTYRKAYQYYG